MFMDGFFIYPISVHIALRSMNSNVTALQGVGVGSLAKRYVPNVH